MSKTIVSGVTADEERAFYHLQNAEVQHCTFDGEKDGESALKEGRRLTVSDCRFALRYPLWHCRNFSLAACTFTEKSRAPIWYSSRGVIANTEIGGVKCLRECRSIALADCRIASEEFGWKCRGISLSSCTLTSQYAFLAARDVQAKNLTFIGKYSFQYTKNLVIENSVLDTKDAFWHSKGAVVRDSVIRGEYLGWYSDSLVLERCRIIGTQPLCYCKNLRLIDCTMEETDLAFEYSDVTATVSGKILSVKNPRSGSITADSYGEIITSDSVFRSTCRILTR